MSYQIKPGISRLLLTVMLVLFLSACGGGGGGDSGGSSLGTDVSALSNEQTQGSGTVSAQEITPKGSTGSNNNQSANAGVATGSFTLGWTAPVSRTDGSPLPLTDISGYVIYYGKTRGDYSSFIIVSDGSAQGMTITDVPVGTYYIAMTTYDVDGRESDFSAEITKISS